MALEIDGATTYAATLPPTGLAGDGASRVYQSFPLPAGTHQIALGLRDTAEIEEFTHAAERMVTLLPRQSLAIDFDPAAAGGFIFH